MHPSTPYTTGLANRAACTATATLLSGHRESFIPLAELRSGFRSGVIVGASPELTPASGLPADFNADAVRAILIECDAVSDQKRSEIRSPLWREVAAHGTHHTCPATRQKYVTLHGVTGWGVTDIDAADNWLTTASTRLAAVRIASEDRAMQQVAERLTTQILEDGPLTLTFVVSVFGLRGLRFDGWEWTLAAGPIQGTGTTIPFAAEDWLRACRDHLAEGEAA